MTIKKSKLSPFVYRDREFLERNIPRRDWLLEGAIPLPSIGMMYAWRGSGKTYTGLSLAEAIARGRDDWMGYPIPIKRPVLYVDGEMPLGDMKERIVALTQGKPTNWLFILASEDLADENTSLDLSKKAVRKEFEIMLDEVTAPLGEPFGLIILDNWTSLMGGLDENDNSALHEIKQWLIKLRHKGHSVLLVHHSGKNSTQRGASAREDNLDYSFRLTLPKDGAEHKFEFTWDKTRTGMPNPRKFTMVLEQVGDRGLILRREGITNRGSSQKEARTIENEDAVLAALPGRFKDIEAKTGLNPNVLTRRLNDLLMDGKIIRGINKIYELYQGVSEV